MREYIRRFTGTVDKISVRVGEMAKYLIIGIGLVLIYEVIARHIFDKPTIWAHESSQHLFGFAILLGGAYSFVHGNHVNVDILVRRFSPRTQAWIASFVFLLFALYFGTMLVKSIPIVITSWINKEVTISVWAPPYYPLKTVVPIGAFLMLLQGFAKFLRDIYFAITGEAVTGK